MERDQDPSRRDHRHLRRSQAIVSNRLRYPPLWLRAQRRGRRGRRDDRARPAREICHETGVLFLGQVAPRTKDIPYLTLSQHRWPKSLTDNPLRLSSRPGNG